MGEPSFKKVAQLSRDTAEVAKQNDEMFKLAMQDVQLKKQHLEMERVAFQQERYADIRHQVNQMVDFAIRSLPWWRRKPRVVVDLATEYMLTIKKEVAKHVAMEMLSNKIQEENLQASELVAKSADIMQEVSEADREGAEMEIK